MSTYMMYENGLRATANILDDIANAQADKLAKQMNDMLDQQMSSIFMSEAQAELGKQMMVREGIDTQMQDIRKEIYEMKDAHGEKTFIPDEAHLRVENDDPAKHMDKTSTKAYDDNLAWNENIHRQCKAVDISTGKEVYSTVYNLSDETVRRQMEVESQLHTGMSRDLGMTAGYNTSEYKEDTGKSYYNKHLKDMETALNTNMKENSDLESRKAENEGKEQSVKNERDKALAQKQALKEELKRIEETEEWHKNNESYVNGEHGNAEGSHYKATLEALAVQEAAIAKFDAKIRNLQEENKKIDEKCSKLEEEINSLNEAIEKEQAETPRQVYINTDDGLFKYQGYGYKDVVQPDGTVKKEYQQGEWVREETPDKVTTDPNYKKENVHYTPEERKKLDELYTQLSELRERKHDVTMAIYNNGGKIVKGADGKETLQLTGKAMKLSFDTKKELRKFVFDMQAKNICAVTLADKTNGQYMVMVPDTKGIKKELDEYSVSQNMRIKRYKGYDLSGKSLSMAGKETGTFFTSTIRQEIYASDAGHVLRNIRQAKGITRDIIKNHHNNPSTFSRRHEMWNSMENAVESINHGMTPLADKKYKDILASYDPITHKKTGQMKTEDVLKYVNDKYGKPNGNDIFANFKKNPKVTMGIHIGDNKKSLMKLKSDLIKTYQASGVIMLKHNGKLDRNALMNMKKGLYVGKKGVKLPSEEEINFLLMASDEKKNTHEGLKAGLGMMIRYSGSGQLYDIQRVVTRSKQVVQVTKAGKKLVFDNSINRFKVVRLKKKIKDPVEFEKAKKELLTKTKKVKSSKVKAPSNRQIKKQSKRLKKMEKKDKKNEWWANTIAGKFRFGVANAKQKMLNAINRSPIGRIKAGFGKLAKGIDKLKMKLLTLGGGILGGTLVLIVFLIIVNSILAAIASFFEADTPEETMLYKVYEAVEKEQDKWISDCQDMDKLWKQREKLKYGAPDPKFIYQDWNTYIKTLKIYDYTGENAYGGNASIVVDGDGDIYINALGIPVTMDADGDITSDDDLLHKIKGYDLENSTFQISPFGTTSHDNNIKDILCMTEVMYDMSVKSSVDSWLKQNMTDTKFMTDLKDTLNKIGNFFKAIGDWFTGEDNSEDRLDTYNSGTVKAYAVNLYRASHQESIELIPRILPLKGNGVSDKYCCPDDGCCEEDCFYIDDFGRISTSPDGVKLAGTGVESPVVRLTSADDCSIDAHRCNYTLEDDGVAWWPGDDCSVDIDGDGEIDYGMGTASFGGQTYTANMESDFNWISDNDCWKESEVTEDVMYEDGYWENVGYASTSEIPCPTSPEPVVEYSVNASYGYKKTTTIEYRVASNTGSAPTSEPSPTPFTVGNLVGDPVTQSNPAPAEPRPGNVPTPTPVPEREQTLASPGSVSTTPSASVSASPTASATSSPTPTATSTPSPTPTPVTYYQVQKKQKVEYEWYYHECEGEHEAAFCGGHISVKMNGMVYGISNTYLEAEDGEIPEEKSHKVDKNDTIKNNKIKNNINYALDNSETGWSWWTGLDNDHFLDKLPFCEDIFDIDLAVDYGQRVFPINGKSSEKWKKYEGWSSTNVNLAVMKFKSNWMELYGFDIPINFGITSLMSKDINNIIEALEDTYGASFTESRHEPVRLALECVGNGMYSMDHHGHAYLWAYCSICHSSHCNITDCSGFCSYIYLKCGKLGSVMATSGLASGCSRISNYNGALPGDMIIKATTKPDGTIVSTGEGGSSHALIYIGKLNQDVELSNGNVIKAGYNITVDCLTIGNSTNDFAVDFGCGNIYLRVHAEEASDRLPSIPDSSYMRDPANAGFAKSGDPNYVYLRKYE